MDELVEGLAERKLRTLEYEIRQHAEATEVTEINDVTLANNRHLQLGHRNDAYVLVGSGENRHEITHGRGDAARQIGQVEIEVAVGGFGLEQETVVQLTARVDREFAHETADVTEPIELGEDVVVANDNRDRRRVIEHRRPERRACHFPIARRYRAGIGGYHAVDERAGQETDGDDRGDCEARHAR